MPPPGNDKTDPNVAMNEANAMEQWQKDAIGPNYVPYVSRDVYGNDIAEPDRSNPTRSKHERPLETIRAFEVAAMGKEFNGGPGSEIGLSRVESRQSMNYGQPRLNKRNSTYSAMSHNQMQRNYSYGNMQDQEYVDDGDIMQAADGRNPNAGQRHRDQTHQQQYSSSSSSNNDPRNNGYGSPVSDSGRAQYVNAPPPQRLNYQTPPTPPSDAFRGQQQQQLQPVQPLQKHAKKSSWGKRLSFGKK